MTLKVQHGPYCQPTVHAVDLAAQAPDATLAALVQLLAGSPGVAFRAERAAVPADRLVCLSGTGVKTSLTTTPKRIVEPVPPWFRHWVGPLC